MDVDPDTWWHPGHEPYTRNLVKKCNDYFRLIDVLVLHSNVQLSVQWVCECMKLI